MISRSILWSPALRLAILAPALAAPAAAQVTVTLSHPDRPLDSLEEYIFKAIVGGAGTETGVLWSISRVIGTGEGAICAPVEPWYGVRFEPDGEQGTARFAARGAVSDAGQAVGLQTYQIRAASRKDPSVFDYTTVQVKPGTGTGPVEETKAAAVETKAAAVETSTAAAPAVLAWETPFRSRLMSVGRFHPAVLQATPAGFQVLGFQAGDDHHWLTRLGIDGTFHELTAPDRKGPFEIEDRAPLVGLPDGGVLTVDSARTRIWKLAPDGKAEVFAGTGEPGWNGDVDDQGHPRLAREAQLGLVMNLTLMADGSLAFVDAGTRRGGTFRIRRITPAGTIETLAGGGSKSGQDLRLPRPALGLRLKRISALAAAPDGRLVLTYHEGGIAALEPDGVIQPLSDAKTSGILVVTTDGRVVYGAAWTGDLLELVPDGPPLLLAAGQRKVVEVHALGKPLPPLVAATATSLGAISRVFPVPGGGLIGFSLFKAALWYIGPPGKDQEWARQAATVLEAMEKGDFAKALKVRAALEQATRAGREALPAYKLKSVFKKGMPGLPAHLQSHIQTFLNDADGLALRARITLHVMDRQFESLPAETRKAFEDYRAEAARKQAEARRLEHKGDSKAGH